MPDLAPMTTTRPSVLFYATAPTPFPAAGIEERHSETMFVRSLREGAPIRALLNHHDEQVLATTGDGSLRVSVEASGLRCELREVPDTAPGQRLAEALAAGRVAGASFAFTPRRARWHVRSRPMIRELLDVDLFEVSVVLAPLKPANRATWAAALGPRLRARFEALRNRPGAGYRPPEPPRADVELRLEPLELSPMIKFLLGDAPAIRREQQAARAAASGRPNVHTVDIVYPRPLAAYLAAHARHLASITSGQSPVGTAAGTKPWALPERPAIVPAAAAVWGPGHPCFSPSAPKPKGAVMHDDTLPHLRPANASPREIPDRSGCDGVETLRRIKKYIAQSERALPGSTRSIEKFRPYTDDDGVWHAGPIFSRSVSRKMEAR